MTDLNNNNSVVMIYDVECLIAITHKYTLHIVGVFRDEDGYFPTAVLNDDELNRALAEYYDNDSPFQVPYDGLFQHRKQFQNIRTEIVSKFQNGIRGA